MADMTLAEKISQVPELYDKEDRSTASLLRDTGFLETSQPLKVEEVEDALRGHPQLVDRWLERGRDQLLTGGWGIERGRGEYHVQSFSTGRHLVEKKKLHAVAEFVVRYVGFVREVLLRYRRYTPPSQPRAV